MQGTESQVLIDEAQIIGDCLCCGDAIYSDSKQSSIYCDECLNADDGRIAKYENFVPESFRKIEVLVLLLFSSY